MKFRYLLLLIAMSYPLVNSNDLVRQLVVLDLELTMLNDLLPQVGRFTAAQKLASDREVVKALYRLASIEAPSWQAYGNLLKFIFNTLKNSPAVAAEKKDFIDVLLGDVNVQGSFLNFARNHGLKMKPGGKIDEFIKPFFTNKIYNVTNERVQNLAVELYDNPSQEFNDKIIAFANLLSQLFYTMQDPATWEFIFPQDVTFVEKAGQRSVDQNEILKRILLNMLVAQRPDPRALTEDEKNLSDAVFYQILASKAGRADRDVAFKELTNELDWLRINPLYLKFRGMMCELENQQVQCSPHALLTLLSDPKKVVPVLGDDEKLKGFSAARLMAPLREHYFGNVVDDFGVDAFGESKFTTVKALMATELQKNYL